LIGTKNLILWGETTTVGNKLFWCEGNATVEVPVNVSGNTDQLFLLVSKPQETPNLQAVPLDLTIRVDTLYCLHTPEIEKLCRAGNRTQEKSPWEKLLEKFKLQNTP